jgi:hypothetical protein
MRGVARHARNGSDNRYLPSSTAWKAMKFTRKHAGKLGAAAGAGLGALAIGGGAYLKSRYSKHKKPHQYDAKTKSYKPVD